MGFANGDRASGLHVLILALLLVPAAKAQRESSIQANVRGGGGEGKCTFEVVVDGVAEVQVRGDRGVLRTISGDPARWVRLDCNQVLPANPDNFRFRGIDGRGRQTLVRNPRSNRGTAVVRIEDPKGGSEGFTGDLMWSGGGYGNPGPGPGPGMGRPPGPGGGGWSGQNGGTFNYRGDGNGVFIRNNGPNMRVRDVNVNLARNGAISIAFQAQGFGPRLSFSGRVTRYGRDSVEANVSGGRGTNANATIFVDRDGSVQRIDMNGQMQRDNFRLNWRSR
jgi:hypothetical protein